ncbi:MAG: sorbosone dehydrogenase family protein [Vicinamibacterales bacterium]
MSLLRSRTHLAGAAGFAGLLVVGVATYVATADGQSAAPATAPFSDYRVENAGTTHRIRVADLPKPFATEAVNNGPKLLPRPASAAPTGLPGYTVTPYAEGLENPRLIRTAPNGDLFVAETGPGRIRVLRGRDAAGMVQEMEVFAADLSRPFGIAFYPAGPNPQFVYVGNTDSVVRFPYQNGDLKARGPKETIVTGAFQGGGHSTRDVVFSPDGKKMYVGVGSRSNVDDPDTTPAEKDRATVLEFNVDGSGRRVYATGLRNAAGLAVHPTTGQIWVTVNERDNLGDNLVPDYVSHIEDGGFYGWPYYYLGGNPDPRLEGKHPELKDTVKVPDVLLQPHSAPLGLAFYNGRQFAAEHRSAVYVASHGSWNKGTRTGYKIIRLPLNNGVPTGEYQDFVTGFVTADGQVWGRPVGVAVAADGALMVSDDGTNSIWQVRYTGK